MDTWLITLISIAYLSVLFVVGYYGEKQQSSNWVNRPVVYSLSLAVSCTSWAFYGMVGQSAVTGELISPVYLGTILCIILLWPMLLKMLRITKRQNITSIADFIACRYGRSPKVAVIVSLVALLGTVPYVALQLRAVSTSFDLLTGTYQSGANTALVVTLVLIVFSILFGTRQIAANKQNQGLVLAIAFSSIVKLVAFLVVGIFVTYFMFDGFIDVLSQQRQVILKSNQTSIYSVISQVLLGALTIFILPRQFHMMMIENHHEDELKRARWLFPLYILLINLFVLPIAIAGLLTFSDGNVAADTFVLSLPLYAEQTWLALLVYIGGLAAATGMVIVAAIVLSTMVANEIVNPIVLKLKLFGSTNLIQQSDLFLKIRRLSIIIILLLAFCFERFISQRSHLSGLGMLSFILLSQLAPLIIGALYWRKATTKAAIISLVMGSLVWGYTLLLPMLSSDSAIVLNGPMAIAWLKPTSLFGIDFLDDFSHGLFFSLMTNICFFVAISICNTSNEKDKRQADVFLDPDLLQIDHSLTLFDVQNLLKRFVEPEMAEKTFKEYSVITDLNQIASNELIEATRLQLSGVLGSASTRMVIKAVSQSHSMPLDEVVSIVDEASEMLRFNRELLQAAVENIDQGISVIDIDMRLVAWNRRYIELMDYPDNVVKVGMPIAELLRFNATRGLINCDDIDEMVTRRINHMRQGHRHHNERILTSGIVLEIRGQAMPGGGFVTSYSDVTQHIEAEKALQQANDNLEKRVLSRTAELAEAKIEAEQANQSKTRFLAAASHDLMQPFNALSLFTSMLKQKVQGSELAELADHIDDSLVAAEALLSDLVEISKLDSGSQKLQCRHFPLSDILTPLGNEFLVIAKKELVEFSYQTSRCWVNTDKTMLRRIIQNFLSNAINYCEGGKVLLGVRHVKGNLRIEVWDTGPGIAKDKLELIFKEFERLHQVQDKAGLGLGLAISERIAKVLSAKISVKSDLGKGSCFSIELPRYESGKITNKVTPSYGFEEIANIETMQTILVIDNDPLVLTAMTSLLTEWGYDVVSALNGQNVSQIYELADAVQPKLILADYHLENTNGVDLVLALLNQKQWKIPCIINSADPSETVREHTINAKFSFIRKPIKALALKRLMRKLIVE